MKVVYYSLSRPPPNLAANKDYFNNHFLDNHLVHKTCENSEQFCFERWVSHFLMIASEINQELISALLLIPLMILEKGVFFFFIILIHAHSCYKITVVTVVILGCESVLKG